MSSTPPAGAGLDAGDVTTAVADGIATVTFFHPKGNSLPGALLRRLADEIAAAGARDDARVIVLRSGGAGPFCAGASFDELKAVRDAEGGREFFSGFARVILAMTRAPKFVVARIHGRVAGGGIGITAASDYAIAVEKASLRLSELALGIGPFVVGPVIERKVGLAAFSAMAVDADWRDAAWGERWGLYTRVVADEAALDEAVTNMATTLARSNPAAMAQMKRVFWRGTEDWDTLLAERAAISGELALSEFTRQAIAGFGR